MYKNAWCTCKVVVLPIGVVTRDTYDPLTGGNWSGACDRTLPPLFTSPSGDSCIMFPVCIRLHELIPTQSHSGMSSFRFSIQIKFSFWYEISFWFHVNWTRNSFPIEIAPRLIWSEWRMRNWSGAKTTRARTPKGYVTRDYSQRRFSVQQSVAKLLHHRFELSQYCYDIVALRIVVANRPV